MTSPITEEPVTEDAAKLVAELRETHLLYNRGPDYEPLRIAPSELQLRAASTISTLILQRDAALKERDAQYDENVNRIAAEGQAILQRDAAIASQRAGEEKLATAERENDMLVGLRRQQMFTAAALTDRITSLEEQLDRMRETAAEAPETALTPAEYQAARENDRRIAALRARNLISGERDE